MKLYCEDYLYHHGIKGQRWGIRRFQNKDGSLTSKGHKRYNYKTDSNYKTEKKIYDKEYAKYYTTFENPNKLKDATFRLGVAKEQAKMKNISADKLSKKSKHQINLETKYKESGLNNEQATAAARRRIKAERRVAIMAGVALATAAAYYGAKKYSDYTDKIIKTGASLQRIEMKDTTELHDRFFAADGKHDKARYNGLLGLTRIRQTGEAHKLDIRNTGPDAKIASNHSAKKIFNELYKTNSEFKNAVDETKDSFGKKSLNKYDRFNRQLVYGSNANSKAQETFIKALKDKGYSGVIDINDQKYSGYSARNPYIMFNNGNFKIMKGEAMTNVDELKKEYIKELAKANIEKKVNNSIMPGLGIGGGILAIQAAVMHTSNDVEPAAKSAYASTKKQKNKGE